MTTRTGRLTREEIVDVAMAHVDALGLGSLSTRQLAAELGVTPMALYRHVRNKDEILVAVVDVLLTRLGLPGVEASQWRAWLEELAQSLRGLFVEHPVAVEVFARQPVTTPGALRRLTAASVVLEQAGFAPEEAVRVYAAVHTYTVGFCALEATRRAGPGLGPDDGPAPDDATAALIAAFVSDDQFAYGLRSLIAGIAPGWDTR